MSEINSKNVCYIIRKTNKCLVIRWFYCIFVSSLIFMRYRIDCIPLVNLLEIAMKYVCKMNYSKISNYQSIPLESNNVKLKLRNSKPIMLIIQSFLKRF